MAKLGYTWYPKDWGNSESVFELNLSERGMYRELIDLAMLNDNKTEINKDVWCRKFCVNLEDLNLILSRLVILKLITLNDKLLFIPSCESRLNLVRGGSKGGKTSKPTSKPISKPFGSLDEKNEKPTSNQKKLKGKETKEKENNTTTPFSFFNSLIHLGIEKQLVNDFLSNRKTKKLTNTQSAFNGLLKEIEKSGKTPAEIISICAVKGWGSFKASWDFKDEIDKELHPNGIGRTNQKILTYDED